MLNRISELGIGIGLGMGICALLFLLLSQPYSQGEPQQDRQKRTNPQTAPELKMATNQKQQSQSGTEKQEPKIETKTYWGAIADFVESRHQFVAAISTIVIAAFTIALVLATVALFISSEKVAKSASKSAEIAERALIAGERAFVSVSFRHAPVIVVKTGEITHWQFTPIWTNAGNTPTRDMTNHISSYLFDKGIPADWDFPDLWDAKTPLEEKQPTPLGISAKTSIDGQTVSVTVDQLDEVINGKKFLYLWGWAAYNDVFPNTARHVTRFAVKVFVGGESRDKDRISFSYSVHRRYNCSDEECERQSYPATWTARTLVIK